CVCDQDGWWRIRPALGGDAVTPQNEREYTTPLWNLGNRSYGYFPDGGLFAVSVSAGFARAEMPGVVPHPALNSPDVCDITSVCMAEHRAFALTKSVNAGAAVQVWDRTGRRRELLREPFPQVPETHVSVAQDFF